jgi:hypothetical protein
MKTAVVFVSYLEVPEQRLHDHFCWNDAAYRENDVRVFVVSDRPHDVPEHATVLVFPVEWLPVVDGKPRFSLTLTKNFGNSIAAASGAESIICTDVDIAFPQHRFRELSDVNNETANIPLYRMAPSFEAMKEGRLDHGCTGTIVMTADNWLRIRFDERCVGYGADDGILLRDIQNARLKVDRTVIVSHVAHVPGDGVRHPGSGSATCWGRDSGFNFDNFQENRKLHRLR